MLRNKLIILLLLSMHGIASGQIYLSNPSFEGEPQDATVPMGWQACEPGTTPDILPGAWGVTQSPYEGSTYMGLITREDGSWESVGQRTSETLKKGECFEFSLVLANSHTYAGYNLPVRFRVWGGNTYCTKTQLLGETGFIDHPSWKKYEFQFTPKDNLDYIIFEAYKAPGMFFPYKGNVIIDDVSHIKKCRRA